MQKIVNLLEQHVQWIAIAAGALFTLFMIYSYVLQSPTQVQVGNENQGPGEVARYTNEKTTQELKSKIEGGQKIALQVPKPAEQFKLRMAWQNMEPAPLPDMFTRIPADVFKEPAPGNAPAPQPGGAPAVAGNNPPQGVQVNQLPVPPKPEVAEARAGRSVIVPPGPNGQQPQQPAAPGQLPPDAVDKDWVTQAFKVSLDKLAAEFKNCGLTKDPFNKTSFLVVEMVRQEILPDGSYGPEQPVPPLGVTWGGPPAPPWTGEPAPPAKAGPDQLQYMSWADQNVRDVVEPPFFQIFKGDTWAPPGALAAQASEQLDLDHPPAGWDADHNSDLYKKVMQHRQELARKREEDRKQKAKSAPRAPTGGRGEGGGIPGSYAPKDTARPAPPPARPATPPRRDLPPGGVGLPPGAIPNVTGEGGEIPGGIGAPPAPVNLPQPGTQFPNNPFDATQWAGKEPMTVWAHDADVKPGRTYRYKMRYRIKNPIFTMSANVAKNPAWVNQMTIASEFSEWSKPVQVPALTNFFIARGIPNNRDQVDFEVFTWKDGKQHSEMFKVQPGDPIGLSRGDTDYATGWTFLGLQDDPRPGISERMVLLVDKDGTVISKNRRTDEVDPLYKTLKDQVNQAKATEAAQAGSTQSPTGSPGPAAASAGH